jgi:glucose/arabinose dehydrogenase
MLLCRFNLGALQQARFPPTRLADSPDNAWNQLFMLPGAIFVEPELSWKYEVAPAGTTFVKGSALGAHHDGTLWIGSARAFSQVGGTGGSLHRITLSRNRLNVDVSDPRLADRVADNLTKFSPVESESLIIGTGFGTTPSIEQAPDGSLYVVSITDGTIYEISDK